MEDQLNYMNAAKLRSDVQKVIKAVAAHEVIQESGTYFRVGSLGALSKETLISGDEAMLHILLKGTRDVFVRTNGPPARCEVFDLCIQTRGECLGVASTIRKKDRVQRNVHRS